jgi:hypothetical protein
MPIPAFDHNLVLPPHAGNPAVPADLSPYDCTTVELCKQLGNTPERRTILKGFLTFRAHLHGHGLRNGYQWIDGSFIEDVEKRENRAPGDIDVVTVYWGYDIPFQLALIAAFPEIANPPLSKQNFHVDHYPFDASHSPQNTVEWTRYWMQFFCHNRQSIWKGILRVSLNTPGDDALALAELNAADAKAATPQIAPAEAAI